MFAGAAMMQKAKRALNECLKHIEDIEREDSPERVARAIKLLKMDIYSLLRIIDEHSETIVRFPHASRAH
jgi:hypothetical protein